MTLEPARIVADSFSSEASCAPPILSQSPQPLRRRRSRPVDPSRSAPADPERQSRSTLTPIRIAKRLGSSIHPTLEPRRVPGIKVRKRHHERPIAYDLDIDMDEHPSIGSDFHAS